MRVIHVFCKELNDVRVISHVDIIGHGLKVFIFVFTSRDFFFIAAHYALCCLGIRAFLALTSPFFTIPI